MPYLRLAEGQHFLQHRVRIYRREDADVHARTTTLPSVIAQMCNSVHVHHSAQLQQSFKDLQKSSVGISIKTLPHHHLKNDPSALRRTMLSTRC